MLYKAIQELLSFCICSNISEYDVNASVALAFLEFLVENNVSTCVLKNHVSAVKAMCVVYRLKFQVWDHPRVKYFLKAVQINQPLKILSKNVMDVSTLQKTVDCFARMSNAVVYRAVFVVAFFGFFGLPNCVPHSIREFDPSRHFTGVDVFFENDSVNLLVKWSKTLQN